MLLVSFGAISLTIDSTIVDEEMCVGFVHAPTLKQ